MSLFSDFTVIYINTFMKVDLVTTIVKALNGVELTETERDVYRKFLQEMPEHPFDWKLFLAMGDSKEREKEVWDKIKDSIK